MSTRAAVGSLLLLSLLLASPAWTPEVGAAPPTSLLYPNRDVGVSGWVLNPSSGSYYAKINTTTDDTTYIQSNPGGTAGFLLQPPPPGLVSGDVILTVRVSGGGNLNTRVSYLGILLLNQTTFVSPSLIQNFTFRDLVFSVGRLNHSQLVSLFLSFASDGQTQISSAYFTISNATYASSVT